VNSISCKVERAELLLRRDRSKKPLNHHVSAMRTFLESIFIRVWSINSSKQGTSEGDYPT
jgi:hypothetical protein